MFLYVIKAPLHSGQEHILNIACLSPPYMVFELPSNLVLRRVGAANWLSFIAFAWGTVMMAQAWAKNYQTLMVLRFFIGFFESGFFPG